MIIDKKQQKSHRSLITLIVGVLLNSLYRYIRCNEIVLVSVTIRFQTSGTRKFDESSGVRVGRKVKNHCLTPYISSPNLGWPCLASLLLLCDL